MDELKKYFNSNRPLGVCTYLPLVALETVDSCISISSATSFKVNGTKAFSPEVKNFLWNFTMDSTTLYMVCLLCSILFIIHRAEFSLSDRNSVASSELFLIRFL